MIERECGALAHGAHGGGRPERLRIGVVESIGFRRRPLGMLIMRPEIGWRVLDSLVGEESTNGVLDSVGAEGGRPKKKGCSVPVSVMSGAESRISCPGGSRRLCGGVRADLLGCAVVQSRARSLG